MTDIRGVDASKGIESTKDTQASSNTSTSPATKLYETVADEIEYGSVIDKEKLLKLIEEYLSACNNGTMSAQEQNALIATISTLKKQILPLFKLKSLQCYTLNVR